MLQPDLITSAHYFTTVLAYMYDKKNLPTRKYHVALASHTYITQHTTEFV